MELTPKPGPGRFQWNQGGWFGAQVGGSLWLMILAGLMFARDWRLGVLTLACFLAPNVVGTMLWMRRDRIAPYPAIQIMLGTLGVSAVVAVGAAWAADRLEGLYGTADPVTWLLALLVVPGMMVLFHFMERAGVRGRTG
ncbi:MAG: hypothetical protein ACYTGP_04240 [Planctomycetota bacterium]|jgi:hypothetical protein